jgi:hypothetical protein
MAQINPRTFADAKNLGDNVYELILTNWGNRGLAQDLNNGSISYPPVKSLPNGAIPIEGVFTLPEIPSLAAIAIAPRSHLDRCILHFTALPQTPPELTPNANPIDAGFVNNGNMLESEQLLSIRAPLIGQLPGPIIIRAVSAHWYSDTYFRIGAGIFTPFPFGTAIPPNVGDNPVWNNPELRLLLYLTGRSALPPPVRAPLHIANPQYTFTTVNEELLSVVPVMGRKYVRIHYKAGFNDVVVRVTGSVWNGQPTGPSAFEIQRNFEMDLGSTTNILGLDATEIIIDNPGVSYLLLKVKAGILDVGRFTIDAFD